MTDAANNPYLRDAVLTATPEQLQLMLYDGALRFVSEGRQATLEENWERAFDNSVDFCDLTVEPQKSFLTSKIFPSERQ